MAEHIMSNREPSVQEEPPVEIGYTKSEVPMRSPPMVEVSDDECYAKIVRTIRNNDIFCRYFLKVTTDNQLIDPWDDSNIKASLRMSKTIGRDPYKFKEISKLGFDTYMLFLSGRSNAHFIKASREIKNG